VSVQIVFDSSDQCGHVAEGAATDTFVGNLAEPTFDQVQPGTRSRDKVEMESRMPPQPGFHTWMFVGAIIVYDEVQVEFGRGSAVDFLEETDKFLVPMARHTVADYLAVEHAEGCEEGGRAVAFIIVRPSPATALLHREARLGAVEGLDLTLLVHTQNQGLVRRIQIQTNDVAEFLDKAFIAAELEGPDQMRLEVVLLPDPLDSCLAETLGSGHATRAPVGGIGGCGVQRSFNYRSDFFH